MRVPPADLPGAFSSSTSPVQANHWTDVKVKRTILYSISGLFMAGATAGAAKALGCTLMASCPVSLATAIPLATVGIISAIYSQLLVDYEDPIVLTSLRKESSSMDLSQVVKKHGWTKLFQHTLLNPLQFQDIYRAHANAIPFNEILSTYNHACDGVKKAKIDPTQYTIPTPLEWENKFKTETKSKSCLQIVDHYPVDDLQKLRLITPAQYNVLRTAAQKRVEFNQRRSELEQQFYKNTYIQRAILNQTKEMARLNYHSHPAHALTRQLERDRDEQCRIATNTIDSEIAFLENEKDRLLREAIGCFDLKELHNNEKKINQTIRQLKNEKFSTISRIRSEFDIRLSDASQALYLARQLRDQSIALAEAQFRITTLPQRNYTDRLHAKNQSHLDHCIHQLDQEYRHATYALQLNIVISGEPTSS